MLLVDPPPEIFNMLLSPGERSGYGDSSAPLTGRLVTRAATVWRLASSTDNLDDMDAQRLFPDGLSPVYEATRRLMLGLGDDVVEEFSKTQVSFGSARKFAWLTPVTKTKALLIIDLWEERTAPQLRNVIRYRADKFTHQVEVRTAEEVEAVDALGWFHEAPSWGRKQTL